MKFAHTRRGVVPFFLLGLVTLTIYDAVVLNQIGQEINEIRGDEDRKSMPFWLAWLLGWITLGLVPLFWACRVAQKIEDEEAAIGIDRPRTSFRSLFCWNLFGIFVLVGPWIGWHRFLTALNQVEIAINEGLDMPETKMSMSSFASEAPLTEERSMVKDPASTHADVISKNPTPEKMKPYTYVPPEKPAPSAQIHIVPSQSTAPKEYKKSEPKKIGKWQVRYADGTAVKYFSSEEDAIAFAKSLAVQEGVSVRTFSQPKVIKKESN